MERQLNDYYRLPEDWTNYACCDQMAGEPGFFRFGPEAICYGRYRNHTMARAASIDLSDARKDVRFEDGLVRLPIDAAEVIDNLRRERYAKLPVPGSDGVFRGASIRKAYYAVRQFLPVPIRRHLQRVYFSGWRELPFPSWPVDTTVDSLHEEFLRLAMKARGVKRVPFIWFWPSGARNGMIMTHDVETETGRDFTSQLMDLDESRGMKASFQVVPEERYEVPISYVEQIRARGFEFNVHDLNHDGTLFRDHREFLLRAAKINSYVKRYGALGFRSGSMYRNQDWFEAYDFSYDMSVPNVAHLEPQRGGCCTVMPYFVGSVLEIPLTMAQDYTLFHILNDYSLDLWKTQIALIQAKHGLISFIIHPDYVIEARARKTVATLLDHLRDIVPQQKIWLTVPGEVDRWWRARSRMVPVWDGHNWRIQGRESHRARIAFAVLDQDRLVYELPVD